MLYVVGGYETGKLNIITVGADKREAVKYSVYESLVDLGSIADAERHAQELKPTKGDCYGRLRNFLWSYRRLQKGTGQMDLQEHRPAE
ncbi:unnamed protein product [Dibothriocephalus latus]|uniref:Uncharacterized protein n=1 Tax=Dibothriocephalus latus TaxID=60516 RepID=A0A3P7LMC8_DIBLA|nr:unnamed protein product [Dibothriocephalus latus]